MKPSRTHLVLLAIAAALPLARPESRASAALPELPDFPARIEGRALSPCAPSELEAPFLARFPGRVGRFTDGERLWILRQVATPTLALHSSARCLRAAGWNVAAAEALKDAEGSVWSAVRATREGVAVTLRERVVSHATGRTWPDVDAWRWDTWFGRDPGPWCAMTAIERVSVEARDRR